MDDCGQLTIRCSQDYFSLDCGITAFELSDYSPGDEPRGRGTEPQTRRSSQEVEQNPSSEQEPEQDHEPSGLSNHQFHNGSRDVTAPGDDAKRCPQRVSLSTEPSPEPSPTHPPLPKRASLLSEGGTGDPAGGPALVSVVSGLQLQAELSRSTPSLMDAPDRTRFWLDLDTAYLDNMSQSCENLQVRPSMFCSLVLLMMWWPQGPGSSEPRRDHQLSPLIITSNTGSAPHLRS